MDDNTFATVISTIIATIVASAIASWVSFAINKSSKLKRLSDKVLEMNHLVIEYPYFEKLSFCSSYTENLAEDDDNYIRYESFCAITFNVLEDIFIEFNGDSEKINEFIGIEEIIILHKKWWLSPRERAQNIDGYKLEFVNFVDDILDVPSLA